MLKRYLFLTIIGFAALQCGKSECKKYTEHFCKDEKSPGCEAAKTKIKTMSQDQCRMDLNEAHLEEQAKHLENELK